VTLKRVKLAMTEGITGDIWKQNKITLSQKISQSVNENVDLYSALQQSSYRYLRWPGCFRQHILEPRCDLWPFTTDLQHL